MSISSIAIAKFDRHLIDRCQTNAPRYTSYPTSDRFSFDYDLPKYYNQITDGFVRSFDASKDEYISLYIHIPFCNTLCLFCACNKIITNDRSQLDTYIDYLQQEIDLYCKLIKMRLKVIQLHFGGGSPSWLSITQIDRIMHVVNKYFDLSQAQEIAMEIDPRHTDVQFIHALRKNGFNRISIGVQDLDLKVQRAVNRIQPYEQSKLILDGAKNLGFSSTNVDLIYGLPYQNLHTFTTTVEQIIKLSPDRIALFNYAHIPTTFMPQTRFKIESLPTPAEKLDILQMSVEKFTSAGYVFIGMDHFAKPEDNLALALTNGTLQRNFQGYSTFADSNMLAFGVSSIGFIGKSYYQNVKDMNSYYKHIDNGELPLFRGHILTIDDVLRKNIISQIMCQFKVDYENISREFEIDFATYFQIEISDLKQLEDLGLVKVNDKGFEVSSVGRFLLRNIAVIFDKYLRVTQDKKRYSQVI